MGGIMSNDIQSIAGRLAELRTFSDYTTAQMAELLGIGENEYISFESGKGEIPINLIYKFASVVDSEPMYILRGAMPTKDDAVVVYNGTGLNVERYEGYVFTPLAPDFKHKIMNPMLVTLSPTDTPELVVHSGQEFNFVLEGKLRVIVGDQEYFLRAGDSLYFNPAYPHAQVPMEGKPAKFLTVITE